MKRFVLGMLFSIALIVSAGAIRTTINDEMLGDTGTITLGGRGNTNNEQVAIDFETTANAATLSSPTGVTQVDFQTLDVRTDTVVLDDATNTVGLALDGDRVFHDTNQDGTKDVGEEYIDQSGSTSNFDQVYAQSVTDANLIMEIDDASGLTFDMTTTGSFIIQDSGVQSGIFHDSGFFGIGNLAAAPGALVHVRNDTTAISAQMAIFDGNNQGVGATGDEAYWTHRISESGGTDLEIARMNWTLSDDTASAEGGGYEFESLSGGALVDTLSVIEGQVGILTMTPTAPLHINAGAAEIMTLQDATDTVSLSISTDRIFHDSNADGVKDAGEEFIDQVGGLQNIVEDTTPQLGGDLDAQAFDIEDVTEIYIGDRATDGTYRLSVVGGDLVIAKRIAGSYSTITSFGE